MKNGYYLSMYCSINALGYIKEVESRHDFNISLWRKENELVELVHYWELERVTGIKQHNISFFDRNHAEKVINELLSDYGLKIDDINEIWGTPGIGNIYDYYNGNDFRDYPFHTYAHAYSAVALDTDKYYNEKILCLAVDSSPDKLVDSDAYQKKFYMGMYCDQGNIYKYDISSPADLWECAKEHYKLREGTLMALASACTCRYSKEIDFEYNSFDFYTRAKSIASAKSFLDGIDCIDILKDENVIDFDKRFSETDNRISMAMKIIQNKSIEIMEKNIDIAIEKFNINTEDMILSVAGGFGLNCPCNSYLMRKYKFKQFVAPPAINDAGISLGVALYQFLKNGEKIKFNLKNSYYGDTSDVNIINHGEYDDFIESIESMTYSQVCEDILSDPIIWFDGNAEMGPRALGHRSLLANAMDIKAKDRLNEIKKREWWRPVAPIVMEEKIDEWFKNSFSSPYMLNNFYVHEAKKSMIPAVLHLDGTARVQTVNINDNEAIYHILEIFQDKYGVPIICNTSLNDKGEPIINTVSELVNFALRKRIKIAYINKKRVVFKNFEKYSDTHCASRRINFKNYLSDDKKSAYLCELNPYGCSDEVIDFYVRYNEKIDITTYKGSKQINISYKTNKRLYETKNNFI